VAAAEGEALQRSSAAAIEAKTGVFRSFTRLFRLLRRMEFSEIDPPKSLVNVERQDMQDKSEQ
jgi:hypothetical protein